MMRKRGRYLACTLAIGEFLAFSDPQMQFDPTPSREAFIKDLLVECVMKAEAGSDGTVGPCDRSLGAYKLFVPCELRAAALNIANFSLHRRSNRRRGKLCAGDTGRFKYALLVRVESFQIALDHLMDGARRFDLIYTEWRTLLDQVVDHVHHEER